MHKLKSPGPQKRRLCLGGSWGTEITQDEKKTREATPISAHPKRAPNSYGFFSLACFVEKSALLRC